MIDLRAYTTEQLTELMRRARASDPMRLMLFDELRRRAGTLR